MAISKDSSNSKSRSGKAAPGKQTHSSGEKPQKHGRREAAIQGIKDDLAKQRETIIGEAEVAITALPEQTVFPDLGDQASAETDRNFMLRLRGREQKLLKKIEEAIERIEAGSFGICETCGEPIDIKRLRARPVTTMCIECKTEQEEEEKMQGNH
ncbi:MAG: RNA polymerase-binding protein DksA [Nitrospiraceae bacterium]|nr:RNA polymerase-binding protein DksA [Nitrospiraceae bacterium]